jgi:hypothetical protein
MTDRIDMVMVFNFALLSSVRNCCNRMRSHFLTSCLVGGNQNQSQRENATNKAVLYGY